MLNFRPKVFLKDEIKSMVKYTKKNRIKNLNSKKYINILNSDKF